MLQSCAYRQQRNADNILGLLDNVKLESEFKKISLDAFMVELFLTPADHASDYKATSAPSDIIFAASNDGKSILDGFAYPKDAHRSGMNVVIHGPAFLAKMDGTHCMAIVIVNSLGYGIFGRNQYAKS